MPHTHTYTYVHTQDVAQSSVLWAHAHKKDDEEVGSTQQEGDTDQTYQARR